MRPSSVSATLIACVPSALSMSATRLPTVSVSFARARVDHRGDVAMRLSSAVTISLPPSLSVLAMSMTRLRQRLGERLAVRLSSVSSKRSEPLLQRGGDLGRLRGDAGVETVDVAVQRFGDFLRACAKPFDELGTVGLHRPVELGEVAGDQVAERRGIARDLLAERGAGMVEHLLERGEPRRQKSAGPHRRRRRRRRRPDRRGR